MKAWFPTTALVAHSGRRARKRPARAELPLGASGEFGACFGLDNRWALSAVRAVGNYGEVFKRNVGEGSPLRLRDGIDGLRAGGGLMRASIPVAAGRERNDGNPQRGAAFYTWKRPREAARNWRKAEWTAIASKAPPSRSRAL